MSVTSSRPDGPLRLPQRASRSLWAAALWTGAIAAALAAAIGVCGALLCWLPEAGVSGEPLSAIRAGLLSFLAAQHGGMTIDAVPIDFVPLGMTATVALIGWRAGTVLADVASTLRERRVRFVVAAGALQTAAYVGAVELVVPIATLGSTNAPAVRTGVAAALLFGGSTAIALCRSAPLRDRLAARTPSWVANGMRGALAAVAVLIAAGALLVALSLVAHAERVTALSRLVGGGLSGVPVAVVGALSAPNASIAAVSYLCGPGFAVGAGTTVDAFSASHGTVPAFPLLGALPQGSGGPGVIGASVAALLAAGWVAAAFARRCSSADAVRSLALSAALAGLLIAVLGWLAGGAVGADRLRTVGPSGWQLGIAVAGEVGGVGLLIVGAWSLWVWLASRGDHAGDIADEQTDEPAVLAR